MASYLVTGGAGFIGSHRCGRLVQEGHSVRVFDNLSSGKRENLSHLSDRVDFMEADLRDDVSVAAAMADVDFVLHHGAIASVQFSMEQPLVEQQVNAAGTLRVLEAARAAGVKRVVFAASAAAYGADPATPKKESMPAVPSSPYGLSKVTGEHYCRIYSEVFGLETVCLR